MNEEKVIKFAKQGGIGIVTLEEREFKNTFTSRFVQGLKDTFQLIRQDPGLRVVVVQGYDNYFCCGGTRDELIQLYEAMGMKRAQGRVQFTDLKFHDLLLNCEIPVISAMQGHALGAGLAFGCYADIIVMGEQCIYSAIFMKYGFTPGFGATYIIPKKFGEALGWEMLLSARNYHGSELKERGASVKIVAKQDVTRTALEIAEELADKPLLSLKVLKEHLSRQIKAALPQVIAQELHMHELTFAQPEVRERIERLFGN